MLMSQKIVCICNQNVEIDEETMVQCEECNSWLHCSCVGLPNNPELIPADYFCPNCRPVKRIDKSDSAKDLRQHEETYQITNYAELNSKKEKLLEGYMVSCKKPDIKMKLPDIVKRIKEIEAYIKSAEIALEDDRTMKPIADSLLLNCEKHTSNETDLSFIELSHQLLSKMIVHNSDQINEMKESISQFKIDNPTYF